jgi:hypothetical protein
MTDLNVSRVNSRRISDGKLSNFKNHAERARDVIATDCIRPEPTRRRFTKLGILEK